MKILSITWNARGGTTTINKSFQEYFRDKNIEYDIAYYHWGLPPWLELGDGKINTYENFEKFISEVNKEYDVIHSHACVTEELPLEVKNRLVYTAHSFLIDEALIGPENEEFRGWLLSLPLDTQLKYIHRELKPLCHKQEPMLRDSRSVILLSNFSKKLFEVYYPEYSQKGIVIPNGSEIYRYAENKEVISRAAEIRESHGGKHDIILYSGRLTPAKGAHDLARAFNLVKMKHKDTSLIFAGEGDREGILANIKPENSYDVKFTNWVEDKKLLASYYKAANVTVVPSYHESFGLTALESMMIGTPVVASNVDGLAEHFVKPWLAYGCEPGNPYSIADRINWVLSNPEEARKNASQVQRVVIEKYNLGRCAESTLALYAS